MKKLLSLALCAVLLASFMSVGVTAADSGKSSTSYNRTNPVKSADDFTWDNASVYFLLTDRFCNGNTANDHSYGRATDSSGKPLSGWESCPGTFHGGDFAGITKKIEEGYFDKLGTNAIWISAPYEQIHSYVTPGEPLDFAHYSYHGYYVLDYTEPDLNFGTKADFQKMVDTAHKHGIRIVMDIVMNHAGYNTIKDMVEFGFGKFKDKSAAESYIYKLSGVNSLHDTVDYENGSSEWGSWWGNSWIRSGLPGYTEGGGSETEMCLAGLPDFRTESTAKVSIPEFLAKKWKKEGTYDAKIKEYGSSNTVTGYISSWLGKWVETYGVDGFRCDTAKHVEFASWKKLKTTCVDALKKWRKNNPGKAGADWDEDFWMTGECWGYKFGYGGYYTDGGFDSMINFSFSGSGVPAVGSIDGLYKDYSSQLAEHPGFNTLSYISSHDSNLARNDLYYQGSAFQLMPGGIQIYYGDETNRSLVSGMSFDGDGGSGHSLRSDMNWNSLDQDLLAHWQKVGSFRRNHVSVGAGEHQTITPYSSSTGYVFSRNYDDGETTDSVICVIGAPKNTQLSVNVSSIWSPGVTVTNYYDGKTAVVDENGKATFNSGAQGTILIEGPQPTIHMSLKGSYSFYDEMELTVSLRGADYAMVSVNGGEQFKVVNGDKFKVGAGIEVGTVFKVIMTATNAEETATKPYEYKKKDPNAVTTLYFDDTKLKWGSPKAYIYDDTGSEVKSNGAWPGEAMSLDASTGLYSLDVPDGLENGYVIFSGSNGRYPGEGEKGLEIKETNMLFSSGNSWTPYNGEKADPSATEDPTKYKNIYFDNTSSNFANPTFYGWRSSTDSGDIAWPGDNMAKFKDNIYKVTVPREYDKCIFSDGGGAKTGDLTIEGNLFNGTSWSTMEEPTAPPTTAPPATASPATDPSADNDGNKPTQPQNTGEGEIVLLGDTDLNNKINIIDVTLIQRHIAQMSTLTAKQRVAADVDGNGKVNINDVTAIQCYIAKVYSRSRNCSTLADYYPETATAPVVAPTQTPVTDPPATPAPTEAPTAAPTEPPTDAPTEPETPAGTLVYFANNQGWGTPHIYLWKGSSDPVQQNAAWPGVAMEKDDSGKYFCLIPSDYDMMIFNDGGSGQTADTPVPSESGKEY